MALYIQQHIFSWGDKFSVYDENGGVRYTVKGEVFSLGKKLHIYDSLGEAAYITQRLFTFLPRYRIHRAGTEIGEVVKRFTLFRPSYFVEGLGWEVAGDFFDHDYTITEGERCVATVRKEWFTLGDAYAIEAAEEDEINALCVALIVDAVLSAER